MSLARDISVKPDGDETARVSAAALAHDSAFKHTAGQALYVDDIPAPANLLHIYIALSECAHGRIVSADLSAVRDAPDVALVLTGEDIPGVNDVGPIVHDEPIFALGMREPHVHFAGQALFAVAAPTIEAARAAAKKAKIVYDELPAIVTVDQAMAAQSLLAPPYQMARGDAAAALKTAKNRLKGRIYIGGQEHFYLEGQAAIAFPGEDGDVTVHSSTQHPSEIQHKVAEALGVDQNAVTVEVRRMGGGFGGKETNGNLPAVVAALCAVKTGQPAKMRYDRDDDMIITGKRHDFRIDYDVGFDDAGRLEAMAMEQAARCGWSTDLSMSICDRAMFHADNCYYIPNAEIISYRCRTNTTSNTAFRGFGGPQGMVAIERVIDDIAFHLGKDPLAVRRANFYAPPDNIQPDSTQSDSTPPDSVSGRNITPYHMKVEDCVIDEIVDALVQSSDYHARREKIAAWNARNDVLVRGIALTPVKFGISFTATHLNQAGALVHVYKDGSIHLNHGGTEMGQGLYTKVSQLAADEFGVGFDRVKITAAHTGKVPNTSPTAASSGTDLNGMAALDACRKIKARLADFAAGELGVKADDIIFAGGMVGERVGENLGEKTSEAGGEQSPAKIGARAMAFETLIAKAYMARISLSSNGFYATPKISWDREKGRGRPFYYFAYGAAVSEAVIDRLTGEYRLLRVDILHDVGKSINPAIDLGQIEGGFVQGAGWLTTEELWWDDAGRLKTHAPSTYKIPATSDRAPDMRIAIWEKGYNREETVFRSKAVGEPPLMLGISALMALSDAVARARGDKIYPALDAPATPERVLAALSRGDGNEA